MSDAQIAAVRKFLAENPIILPVASLAEMRESFDGMGEATVHVTNLTNRPVSAAGVDALGIIAKDAIDASTIC